MPTLIHKGHTRTASFRSINPLGKVTVGFLPPSLLLALCQHRCCHRCLLSPCYPLLSSSLLASVRCLFMWRGSSGACRSCAGCPCALCGPIHAAPCMCCSHPFHPVSAPAPQPARKWRDPHVPGNKQARGGRALVAPQCTGGSSHPCSAALACGELEGRCAEGGGLHADELIALLLCCALQLMGGNTVWCLRTSTPATWR